MGQNKDLFVTGKSSYSGSVPEDSGSKYKSPVLDPKGGLCAFRKIQKISTASKFRPILLDLCKKITGGGQIVSPSPQQE